MGGGHNYRRRPFKVYGTKTAAFVVRRKRIVAFKQIGTFVMSEHGSSVLNFKFEAFAVFFQYFRDCLGFYKLFMKK